MLHWKATVPWFTGNYVLKFLTTLLRDKKIQLKRNWGVVRVRIFFYRNIAGLALNLSRPSVHCPWEIWKVIFYIQSHFFVKYLILVDKLMRCCGILKYLFTWIHIPIHYSKSKKRSASSSQCVSLCGGMMDVRLWWNGTMTVGAAPMAMCFG
jgi:hypothetical protein